MSDIVEFLEARIAEDEQTALASASREWEWLEGKLVSATGKWTKCEFYCVWREPSARHRGPQRTPGHEHYRADYTVVDSSADYGYESEVEVSDEDAAHVARHDPARVLREVAAKRAIIKAYVEARDRASAYNYHESLLNGESNGLESAVELLASAYSDHQDYQASWG